MFCPLCRETARLHLRLAHTCVYRCSNTGCRLQFADPQLGDEALVAAYRRLYYPGSGFPPVLESTPREVIVQIFQSIRERLGEISGMRLLDYGCGKGQLPKVALEFGIAPVGIERDPEACGEIERKSSFPVYPDIETLEQREGNVRFDLVILWQVIEHLRRPWDDLARLRGLLASDGWLLAATHNAEGLKARMLRSHWDSYMNPTHFYHLTRQSLAAVFTQAGFSPVEEWRFRISYPDHSPPRRGIHAMLAAARLDSDLLFAGRSGAPSAAKTIVGAGSARQPGRSETACQ